MQTETKQLTRQQLALYLGCEAETQWLYNPPYGNYNNGAGLPIKSQQHRISARLLSEFDNYTSIKPLLRSLSDITEEEARDLGFMSKKEANYIFEYSYEFSATRFSYLLSKGFDLFGFIEQGLAIEKQLENSDK